MGKFLANFSLDILDIFCRVAWSNSNLRRNAEVSQCVDWRNANTSPTEISVRNSEEANQPRRGLQGISRLHVGLFLNIHSKIVYRLHADVLSTRITELECRSDREIPENHKLFILNSVHVWDIRETYVIVLFSIDLR